MKTIENVTLYKCDFCNKELKRKYAMVNHEIKCSVNPLNQRPCLGGCIHLERRFIQYEAGYDDYYSGEPVMITGNTFFCKLKDKFMYHPKIEHRENGKYLKDVLFEGNEIEQTPMPKDCDELDYLNF